MATVICFGSLGLQNTVCRLRIRLHRDAERSSPSGRGDFDDTVERRLARGSAALFESRTERLFAPFAPRTVNSSGFFRAKSDTHARFFARLSGNLDSADELVLQQPLGGNDPAARTGNVDEEARAPDDEVIVGQIAFAADGDPACRLRSGARRSPPRHGREPADRLSGLPPRCRDLRRGTRGSRAGRSSAARERREQHRSSRNP